MKKLEFISKLIGWFLLSWVGIFLIFMIPLVVKFGFADTVPFTEFSIKLSFALAAWSFLGFAVLMAFFRSCYCGY